MYVGCTGGCVDSIISELSHQLFPQYANSKQLKMAVMFLFVVVMTNLSKHFSTIDVNATEL